MKKIVLSSVLAAVALSAQAGTYVEGQVGYGRLDTNKNINRASNSVGDVTFGGRVGYNKNVSDNLKLGAEVGVDSLGKSSFANKTVSIRQNTADLLGTATLSLNPQFDVFAKAGVAAVQQKNNTPAGNIKFTNAKAKVAGGVAYNFNEKVALTGNVSHIFGNSLNANSNLLAKNTASSTTATVGLRYTLD